MKFNALIILILIAFIGHSKIFSQYLSQTPSDKASNNVFTKGDYKINKAAERWIENKVENGKWAELKKIFPKEKDRVISASFIEKLMTNQNSKIMKQGIRIRDAIIINSLVVDDQDIIYKVDMEDCVFRDEVNFRRSTFHKDLILQNNIFISKVIMEDAILKHDLYLDLSHFKDTISLGYAEIDGNIFATKVRFEGNAIFPAMQVKGYVYFDKSRFMNIADFSFSRVYSFYGDSCVYENNVHFDRMKIEESMICDTTMFNGSVFFPYVEIGGGLQLINVQFKGNAYFNFMKVGQNFYLYNTIFEKPASMVYCDIKNSFQSNNAVFKDSTVFAMMTANDAWFVGTAFHSTIDFRGSFFKTCYLGIRLKKDNTKRGNITLEGMKFESVMNPGVSDNDACIGMLNFLEIANYSASTYEVLENIFLKRGSISLANDVYLSRRVREREEILTGKPFAYSMDVFQYYIYGYGRKPGWAYLWTILILIIGIIIFSEKRMIKRSDKEYESIKFNKFRFSFDLLIPFVQLPSTQIWIPRDDCFVTIFWYRFHKIGGWFTITIGTLAITGLIK